MLSCQKVGRTGKGKKLIEAAAGIWKFIKISFVTLLQYHETVTAADSEQQKTNLETDQEHGRDDFIIMTIRRNKVEQGVL
jgi:hypothetical protein